MTKGSKQVDETGRAGTVEWGYKSNICEPKETQQEDNC